MAIQFHNNVDSQMTRVNIRAEYNSPAESIAAASRVTGYASEVLGIKPNNMEMHMLDSGRTSSGKFFSEFRADILS